MRPPSVSMTLAGLRSRWKMPRLWAAERPSAIWMPAERTSWRLAGPSAMSLSRRLAGDVLHDDVGFFAVAGFGGGLADVVDGADVGVVDGGGEAGLAELGGAHLLGGEVAALEELEDDGALEEGVVGEVDDAAAAGADLADELVLLDFAALHDFIIASVGVWMMKGRGKGVTIGVGGLVAYCGIGMASGGWENGSRVT